MGIVPQEAPTHAYDASKAAVHNLTKKFAADLAPRHITVNCVAPGFVPSRMSAGLGTWGKYNCVEVRDSAACSLTNCFQGPKRRS